MLRQSEIMHEVAQIVFMASKGDFDELVLEVEVDVEGGSVGSRCWQTVNGKVEFLSLWDVDPKAEMENLSYELFDEIKNHTGGELTKYTVTIDKDGAAKARFEYGNEPAS